MATDYNAIAKEYQASKLLPWRKHVEAHTFFQLAGDLTGLNVLDLACGEGFYTRQIKLRGANHVVGVDISEGMIQLARDTEARAPLGLTYHCQNALALDLGEQFDVVCASYLLNYARTADELLQMATVIARHLKPGGRFITINSNPNYHCDTAAMRPYGFTRENQSNDEGAEIAYRFYQPDDTFIEVINYHLAATTHEAAFERAGFAKVQWHPVGTSPAGVAEFGATYWEAIERCQPIVGISCQRT